jgi:PAS domain S-box-containing protein
MPRRKRSNEALKTSEATRRYSGLFYEAFNTSPVGIALEDLEGQPLFANAALCSMLGLSEEEMRAKHCVEFSPPEDAKKDWALFEQLRAGSIDHYQMDKRFLRRDGSLIWGRLTISLLNHCAPPLVVALVEDITEKKAAEEELRRVQEQEQQRADQERRALGTLESVTKQMAAAVACCSRDLRYLWANQGYANLLQRPLDEIVGRPVLELVGKEAFETMQPHFERVLAGHDVHYEEELNYQGVGSRWISAAYTPMLDADGVTNSWVAVVVDITERKLAEEALSTVSQRLIEAQEQERSRLARELHDDINQRIVLLAANLDLLKEKVSASLPEIRRHIDEAYNRVADLGNDIQALSHRLHSPKLELLGLAATARSLCKEVSDQQGLQIDFHSENVPEELSQEISICLFRVLQESLQNATKHSGSRHFQVLLLGKSNEVELTVQDSGIGFEPAEAIKGRGLGLTSMRERLKLVAGQLFIDSKRYEGTTIRARVPINPGTRSARAAG